MRLPIALSPLNIMLIILMLAAPFLGSAAKRYTLSKKQDEKIEMIVSRNKTESKKTSSVNQEFGDESEEISRVDLVARPSVDKISNEDEHQQESNHPANPVQLKAADESAEKTESSRKQLFEALKKYAKTRDFQKAEETFLEHLESSDLSPMESLDKYSKFQEMFQKLSDDYLDSSSSKSI